MKNKVCTDNSRTNVIQWIDKTIVGLRDECNNVDRQENGWTSNENIMIPLVL